MESAQRFPEEVTLACEEVRKVVEAYVEGNADLVELAELRAVRDADRGERFESNRGYSLLIEKVFSIKWWRTNQF